MDANSIEAAKKLAETILTDNPGVAAYHHIGSSSFLLPEFAKDVDYAVLVRKAVVREYLSITEFSHFTDKLQGFIPSGNYDQGDGYDVKWTSIKNGDLNFILTHDEEWYNAMLRATEICKYFNLTHKLDRIAVCRIARDGWSAEATKTLISDLKKVGTPSS